MSLQHGILGFLCYGTMTGYELSKAFSSSVQFFWHAQNSQIYSVLEKLEKNKLVTHETIVQTDRPNKKLYTITPAGREEFLSWLSEENRNATDDFKSAFLMKVFFSGNIPPQKSCAMLKQFVADCETYLNSMQEIPGSIHRYEQSVDSYSALYWSFTADFGYCYLKMCIDWGNRCIRQLEAL